MLALTGAGLFIGPIVVLATVSMPPTAWWLLLEWLLLFTMTILFLGESIIKSMIWNIFVKVLAKMLARSKAKAK